MNVYCCWYKGNQGYCCRRRNLNWMFVPELGQPDRNIYKNIAFEDLVFKNTCAWDYEKNQQVRLGKSQTALMLYKILRREYKPRTTGGLLFCSISL